jgi:hypothetical protein
MLNIIILILYSNDEYGVYTRMKDIQESYWTKIGLKHYFYCFCENIDSDTIQGNMIYLKGTETILPGILDKTLRTFTFFNDSTYDYIVRTNISTIVNYNMLYAYLEQNSIDYGGFKAFTGVMGPYNTDINLGIKYYNLVYFEGSALILSKNAITTILSQRDKLIDENQMDDVSIGVALPYQRAFIDKISDKGVYEDGIICYRNKSNNRITDINNMQKIVHDLIST